MTLGEGGGEGGGYKRDHISEQGDGWTDGNDGVAPAPSATEPIQVQLYHFVAAKIS
jgi:hypothetical protein